MEIYRAVRYHKTQFTVTEILGGGYSKYEEHQGARRVVRLEDSDHRIYVKEFTGDTVKDLPTIGDKVKLYLIDNEPVEPRSKLMVVGLSLLGLYLLFMAVCFIIGDIQTIMKKIKQKE